MKKLSSHLTEAEREHVAPSALWASQHNYVAKKYMDNGAHTVEMLERDVMMQMDSKLLAEAFNSHSPPKRIDFLDAFLIELDPDEDDTAATSALEGSWSRQRRAQAKAVKAKAEKAVKEKAELEGARTAVRDMVGALVQIAEKKLAASRLFVVEAFVPGAYTKHSNNAGYVSPEHRSTPQAFSHFTFVHTGGRAMVVDIQGVDDLYTDPQIHSIHPRDQTRYGMGNLGLRGIGAFFRTHVCDVTCRRLRLPATDLSRDECTVIASSRAADDEKAAQTARAPHRQPTNKIPSGGPAPGGTALQNATSLMGTTMSFGNLKDLKLEDMELSAMQIKEAMPFLFDAHMPCPAPDTVCLVHVAIIHAIMHELNSLVVRNSGIEGIDVGKFLSQRAFRYHIFRAAQRGFLPAIRFLFTNEDGVSPKIRCLPKGCPSMPEGTISTILDAAEVNAAFGIAQDAEDYEVQYAEEMERRASAQRAAVKQARERHATDKRIADRMFYLIAGAFVLFVAYRLRA